MTLHIESSRKEFATTTDNIKLGLANALVRFDEDERVKEIIQADGTVINYTWDTHGNLKKKTVTGPSSANQPTEILHESY